MSINWDLYSARLKINGDSFKERQVNAVVNAINNDFKSSPSYFEVSINGNTTLTGVQIVDNSSNESNKVDYIRKIIMKPSDSISVGDIVDWNSKKWLVTSAEQFSDVYWYGMMQECNNTLKFYNKTGVLWELTEVPCIVTTPFKTNIGESSDRYITTSVVDYQIIIPDNTDTKIVDVGMRFILNGRAFKCEGYDDLSCIGLKSIKVTKTELDTRDDLDNGIAWNESNPVHYYTIEILNGAEQTVKYGNTLQLNVQVKDSGIVVSPTPTLVYETSKGTICTVNNNGLVLATNDSGNAIITVRLGFDSNVYACINIIAAPSEVVNNTYTLEGNMQPDTLIYLNQTKTYTVRKYNNGVLVNTRFLFSIVGDTPSSAYSLTVLNDNQCNLKCLSSAYTITLRALDTVSNQYIDKSIELKNLI